MKRSLFALAKSFGYALRGLGHALATQRNLRLELVCAAFALWLGGRLELGAPGWAVLGLAIGLVLAAELLNTALEAAVDLCCPQQHPLAAAAKDCAAAAVLVCALAALGVGAALFWRPAALLALWRGFFARPATAFVPALLLLGGLLFVFALPYSPKTKNKEQE